MSLTVPIVLLAYNRPELTQRVFESIRAVRPAQLFLVVDGPKTGDPFDAKQCQAVREALENVDWPCEVFQNYSAANMGCGKRVSSGLDWVFSQVKTAIVLEDDTLPHPSFFQFAKDCLDHFQDQPEVMHISGTNLLGKATAWDGDYFFGSFMMPPWGWATWARAWKQYRFSDDTWPSIKARMDRQLQHFDFLDQCIEGNRKALKTWDIQWTTKIWEQKGKIVFPRENLVKNIGYGPDATFTRADSSQFADLPTGQYTGPLQHPTAKGLPFDAELEENIVSFIKEIG